MRENNCVYKNYKEIKTATKKLLFKKYQKLKRINVKAISMRKFRKGVGYKIKFIYM